MAAVSDLLVSRFDVIRGCGLWLFIRTSKKDERRKRKYAHSPKERFLATFPCMV
jgi:hypothetical protein